MMKHLTHASLIALAAAAAPLAAQGAPGSFRLPTPTPTPTATDIQGPVDPDAPILTRPRDTAPTPTPTPRSTPEPAPAPTPTARPVIRPTATAVPPPRNSSLPPRFTPPAAPTAQEAEAVVTGTATPFPESASATDAPAPAVLPPLPDTPAESTGQAEDTPWWLLAIGGLIAAISVGGALAWRRRRRAVDEYVPSIERPVVRPDPKTPLAAEPPMAAGADPLVIEARAVRLSRSMVYATLSYEMQVSNRGGQPLENVRFGADLVTAHARVPTEQQLADPLMPLAPVKTLEGLDPGQTVVFSGELRLPVTEIRPIPHGKAVVYVPLLRVRAEADGLVPVARTFVVGVRPQGIGKQLQPFRLDEMPQTYHTVGQHALD